MNTYMKIASIILVFCVSKIYAEEPIKIVHLIYPESRSGSMVKAAELNVENREALVEAFVNKIESFPAKKFQGVWRDAGFPIVLADAKMNPIKAYKIYDFPESKGVFIEFEVQRDGEGFKFGKMKLTAQFEAKQWPELSAWLTEWKFTKLSTAIAK